MEPAIQEQIRTRGLQALLRELGPVDTARFLRQFENGTGDYSLDRHRWLDSLSLDDAVHAVEEARPTRRAEPPTGAPAA